MLSCRSLRSLAFCAALLCAFVFELPATAQQSIPDNAPDDLADSNRPTLPIDPPPVDYALLNQPGPLWLPGIDFNRVDLYGVNLAGANLRGADFDGANLANADLSGALLVLATLTEADLTGANLHEATLSLADLRFANLPGADLSSAHMPGAILTGALLDGALLTGIDARESDMKQASLRRVDLSQALLAGTNLLGADLTGANLSHADLSSVNLAGANLSGANLDNVTFDTVTVWPANFDVETKMVTGPLPSGEENRRPGNPSSQRSDGQGLAITMTLMPQLLPWFDHVARPQDGSLVDRAQDVALLDEITSGSKMVVFKSVDVAEEVVPTIADKFDIIGYNLEHGPLNPLHEQADPVGSVVRMRALADEYGLALALGLDHEFALSHGVETAPYVDSYAMQVQRVQSQPAVVREFVVPMAEAVRSANPAIRTTVQVRTEGQAEEIVTLIDSVRESIDGVDILSNPGTTEVAMELVELLQNSEPQSVQSSVKAPESLPDSLPEPTSTDPPTILSQILSAGFQLLVIGLAVLFFLIVGRAMIPREDSEK